MLFLLFILSETSVRAVAQWPITTYSTNEGLAQSVVYVMHQSKDGYLWIGTQAGICRFDGHRFTNFSTENGLAHNVVRTIAEDETGLLFIGTERGISVYDGGRIFALKGEGEAPTHVRSLIFDESGRLWGGSETNGLFYYENNAFHYIDTPGHDKFVRALCLDQNGRIWIGFYGSGIGYWDGSFHSLADQNTADNEFVRTFFVLDQDTVLFGSNFGIFQIKNEKIEPFLLPEGEALGTNCTSITRDALNRLWIGTSRRGAKRISREGTVSFGIQEGLPTDGVQTVLADHEGNIWFGTYGGGVSRLSDSRFRSYQKQEGFPYDNVNALFEDSKGDIWLGTNGGGLSVLRDGVFKLYDEQSGIIDDKILCIFEDNQGAIWVGTLRGISKLTDGKFTGFRREQGLPHNTVYDIEQDRHGTLFFGTFDGLGYQDEQGIRPSPVNQEIPGARIEVLKEHPFLDRMVLGTSQGVVFMEDHTIVDVVNGDDGLADDFVMDIFMVQDGRIWIATPKGASLYALGDVTNYGPSEGLSAPICYTIIEGDKNEWWLGTNNGLNRLYEDRFTVFTHLDGLPSNEINPRASLKDREGHLWFGGPRGATIFQNIKGRKKMTAPFITIEDCRVMGQSIPLNQALTLDVNNNFIEFDFTGISYAHATKITYFYRAVGLDKQWIETENPHASYRAMPPGEYTFQVKAKNADDAYSKVVEFSFKVIPPFYKTPVFIIVCLVLLASIVLARMRYLRKRAAHLEEKIQERTLELHQINRELELLALRDELTQVNNRHYLNLIMETEKPHLSRAFFEYQNGEITNKTLGFIMFDIDFFKKVNDSYGHPAGDDALKQIVRRIRPLIRETDVFVRWGGEEFLILLRAVDPGKIGELAERIRFEIGSVPFDLKQSHPIHITISLGYSYFPVEWDPVRYHWSDIVHLSDLALYRAKELGRNTTVGFFPTTDVLNEIATSGNPDSFTHIFDHLFRPINPSKPN